jgi:RNA polymerase sigma-70 factor, ECF subfamily
MERPAGPRYTRAMDTLGRVRTSLVERGTNGTSPAAAASPRGSRELIERLRAGDPAAGTAVVRRYHSVLVYQASRILSDRALAEDVVQDAWLAAFRCIRSFTPRFSLVAWLVRIVINRAKSVRRHEVRSLPFSAWTTREPGDGGQEEQELPGVAHDSSPERLLLEREACRRFDEALRALPETQRAVLRLRDLEGASPAEACRVLRINDLALRVRLCRARASIRRAL